MTLKWNNINTFEQHLEDMKVFRQNHRIRLAEQFKDMPLLPNVNLPQPTGLIESINNDRRKAFFFPIWKIELPQGINN